MKKVSQYKNKRRSKTTFATPISGRSVKTTTTSFSKYNILNTPLMSPADTSSTQSKPKRSRRESLLTSFIKNTDISRSSPEILQKKEIINTINKEPPPIIPRIRNENLSNYNEALKKVLCELSDNDDDD